MQQGVVERLIADLQSFIDSREFYLSRGLMYKRTYLFYGPPGTGKSSLIRALVAHMGLRYCRCGFGPHQSASFLKDMGDDDVLVIEEIDKCQGMSTLMTVLDGDPTRRQITFMTTNHPTKVPAAVLRPGRCDVREYLGACNAQQLAAFYTIFFPEAPQDDATAFGVAVMQQFGGVVMPSTIQEHLHRFRYDPRAAMTNFDDLAEMVEQTKSEDLRDALPKDTTQTVVIAAGSFIDALY
jgi:chaperone BCS1